MITIFMEPLKSMTKIFADTSYWIALINPNDRFHRQAVDITDSLTTTKIITIDEILVEFLAYFSKQGLGIRERASKFVRSLFNSKNIEIIPQSRDSFLNGLALFEQRNDKNYSLVDCISMQYMKENNLTNILSTDIHFIQEGFHSLIRPDT